MIAKLQCVVLDCPDVLELAQCLGATLLHAGRRGWRIFADPAGRPFCLLPG